jgi:hypothetical protein
MVRTAAYRITPKLQAGYYHSNLHVDNPSVPTDPASNHIRDEVVTGRYDVNSHWEVKGRRPLHGRLRRHLFRAGILYAQWNAQGLKPKTNMLVLKASFNF